MNLGKFKISGLVFDVDDPIFRNLMSKMLVVRCERLYAEDCFEYVAYSELFRLKADPGLPVPEYDIRLNSDGFTARPMVEAKASFVLTPFKVPMRARCEETNEFGTIVFTLEETHRKDGGCTTTMVGKFGDLFATLEWNCELNTLGPEQFAEGRAFIRQQIEWQIKRKGKR